MKEYEITVWANINVEDINNIEEVKQALQEAINQGVYFEYKKAEGLNEV